MTAYYNENEPYAAQWLRNLIKEGLIADGHVDERSIEEVEPADLDDYQQCHFFAGLGGWSGALRLAGVPDDYSLWTGSCPCQPFSLAGAQQGFADARHLWPVWQRLIAQCRPAIVLGEQVASAAQWLRLVRSDLEALDYAVGIMPVEAASAGAYHLRDRYWFVAHGDAARSQGRPLLPQRAGQRPARANGVEHANRALGQVNPDAGGRSDRGGERPVAGPDGAGHGDMADAARQRQHRGEDTGRPSGRRGVENGGAEWVIGADGKARRVEPGIRLLAHGIPQRVAKLRALGNAVDLRPAATFIKAALP
jgi:DNA (cytosine-5)-methyltransferase 1